jgi:hypothetical protein
MLWRVRNSRGRPRNAPLQQACSGNLVSLGREKRNVVIIVSLALLLSCCGTYKPLDDLDTDLERSIFACNQYGFYPGTQQFDECMNERDRTPTITCQTHSAGSELSTERFEWVVCIRTEIPLAPLDLQYTAPAWCARCAVSSARAG